MLKRKQYNLKTASLLMTVICFFSMEPIFCQEKIELPEYLNSEWVDNELKAWISRLKFDKTTIQEQEIAFKKALDSSNLPMAETIANGMLTKDYTSEEGLLTFLRHILIILQKNPDYFHDNYDGRYRLARIAAKLYRVSKTPQNEAFALFIIASREDNDAIYLQLMHEAKKKNTHHRIA